MIIVCIYRIDWSFSAIKGYHFMSMGDIIDFLQLRWRDLNLRFRRYFITDGEYILDTLVTVAIRSYTTAFLFVSNSMLTLNNVNYRFFGKKCVLV